MCIERTWSTLRFLQDRMGKFGEIYFKQGNFREATLNLTLSGNRNCTKKEFSVERTVQMGSALKIQSAGINSATSAILHFFGWFAGLPLRPENRSKRLKQVRFNS